jgi:WD40 repeat protein
MAFSPDGKTLGIAGSAPARFGELQFWDVTTNGLARPTNALLRSFKVATDSIYGIAFSKEGDRVSVGGADKTVRIYSVKDGQQLLKFDNHSDWVFGTTWTMDGKRLLTGGRDRAMKTDRRLERAVHRRHQQAARGRVVHRASPEGRRGGLRGENGTARTYKIAENQGRTAANNDVNLQKEFERLPGPVHAVAYNVDGALLAVGGAGPEVRVHQSKDGKRVATLKGHSGAIFALAFHPGTNIVATGGYDGTVTALRDGERHVAPRLRARATQVDPNGAEVGGIINARTCRGTRCAGRWTPTWHSVRGRGRRRAPCRPATPSWLG